MKIERAFRFPHGSFKSHATLSIEFTLSRVPHPPRELVEEAIDKALEELVEAGYAEGEQKTKK